jgi:hypothetical protein
MKKEHKLYRLHQLLTGALNKKQQIDLAYISDLRRRIKNVV